MNFAASDNEVQKFSVINNSPLTPLKGGIIQRRALQLKRKSLLGKILFPFFLLFIWQCARQASPPGGPEDKTPPRILAVSPKPDSTRVGRDTRLLFTFSEKIDRKSFADALFISPSPNLSHPEEEEFRFKWRGREVEVSFPDSLRPQRTYVVTLGTDVRDLRNNRLAGAFTFAFATGDSLDRGEITGRVFASKPSGILIMAYILENAREPNPEQEVADYFTQIGETGEFKLAALAPGKYRVFALGDRDGDRLYLRGVETLGVPTHDIVLSNSVSVATQPLSFRLTLEDTLRPTLAAVTVLARNQLEWRFDEAVAPRDSLWPKHLHVRSESGDTLRFVLAAQHPLNRLLVQTIIAPLQSGKYFASVDSLFDEAGNGLDSLGVVNEFIGVAQPDTIRPRLIKTSIADSARNVARETPLDLFFSEMMRSDTAQAGLLVRDTSQAEIAGALQWLNPFQLRFKPAQKWKSRAQYTAVIQAEKFYDWNGNALFDTTGQITFWTVNADTFASISGKIAHTDSSAASEVFLSALQTGGKIEYRTQTEQAGSYLFQEVLPGLYQLNGFRDANNNRRFDFGRALPFLPAEKYWAWPDTIKVRSRWPNEDNDFVIP
ncbi:MAG: Ig-like domain-containing protein [candidate division KSB1 bacterium]